MWCTAALIMRFLARPNDTAPSFEMTSPVTRRCIRRDSMIVFFELKISFGVSNSATILRTLSSVCRSASGAEDENVTSSAYLVYTTSVPTHALLTLLSNSNMSTFDSQGDEGAPIDSLSPASSLDRKHTNLTIHSMSFSSTKHGAKARKYALMSAARIDGKKIGKVHFQNVIPVSMRRGISPNSTPFPICRCGRMNFQSFLTTRHKPIL